MPLKGKVAVITGGGRGIGKAVAEAFRREGARLLLLARSANELEQTKMELEKEGGEVKVIPCDVSDEKSVQRAETFARENFGAIDILVNAAGIYGPIGRITDISLDEWRKTLDINLTGIFLMTKAVIPTMREKGAGKIINFVGGGEGSYPRFSAYVASKGGVARFTETVASEVREFGIEVNAIAPGAVNTAFLEGLLKAGPERVGEGTYERALQQKKEGGIPPEKAAALCVFLASDKSDGLSGKIFSAVRDPYDLFPDHIDKIMSSDIYTLRRIKPEDRGYKW